MSQVRWVIVVEGPTGTHQVSARRTLAPGAGVELGREGEMALGVAVANSAISRLAVSVHATETGWRVQVPNRNGAVVYPWGQPPVRARARTVLTWPLVALRVLPDIGRMRHWVLLEADDLEVSAAGPTVSRGFTQTDRVEPPGELPPAEREALHTVFEQHLDWPPHHAAQPLLLKQAATRLGLSISGIQDRLKAARARAVRLGHASPGGLTDPGYLYTLVRAGYLTAPTRFPHRDTSAPPDH